MEQYIPKSVLVAEIEKLLDRGKNHEWLNCAYRDGNNSALYALKGKIDTLEVKEVDLERLVNDYFTGWYFDSELDILAKPNNYSATVDDVKEIAKYFFELGLKAQNITTNLKQRISVLKMEFWTGLQTFEETEMTLSDAYNQGVDDILEELGLRAQKGEEV